MSVSAYEVTMQAVKSFAKGSNLSGELTTRSRNDPTGTPEENQIEE